MTICVSALEVFSLICPNCFSATWHNTVCTACHYSDGEARDDFYLPLGHLLCGNQYRVGKVLGAPGGFGITYLALDTRLETKVAIKEYLPRHLASRGSGVSVRPHTKSDASDFHFGMEQFLNEAKTLARMKHPNIIRIMTYFEENRTAYLVMDYLEGESLSEYLIRVGKLTSPDGIQLMLPIIDGLSHIHAQGFIHRDVKPSNIYLTNEGNTILLDFGAARQALQEKSQSMTSILTPGYAPWEQYHRKGNQGPWTDIYSCAAVLYQMLTGQLPSDAQERLAEDSLVPPNKLNRTIPTSVSQVILNALSLKPTDRPQSADAFSRELQTAILQKHAKAIQSPSSSPNPTKVIAYKKTTDKKDISLKKSAVLVKELSGEAEKESSSSSRLLVILAVATILAVSGFGGYQYYQRSNASSKVTNIPAIIMPQQNKPFPVKPIESKTLSAAVAPIPATPSKPLTLQDGKFSRFPYMIRDKVTRAQILDSGLGPLLSSDSKFHKGTGCWVWEYRFSGITINTIFDDNRVEGNNINQPPQGIYKEMIHSITLVDSTYETARGIKIGMSKQDVINQYGPSHSNHLYSRSSPTHSIYNLTRYHDEIGLHFIFDAAGTITKILIWYPIT